MGFAFGILGPLVWVALAIPALVVLLRLYDRTRMSSLPWLIAAVVVVPLAVRVFSMFLPFFVRRLAESRGLPLQAIASLYGGIYLVEALVEGTLLLVAVILLERDLNARTPPPLPPAF